MSTYIEHFEEVFHFAILSMNARNDTFQVRESFYDLAETCFECRVTHEVIDSIETMNVSVSESVSCASEMKEAEIPSIDVSDFS